jgi:hypothetical protein
MVFCWKGRRSGMDDPHVQIAISATVSSCRPQRFHGVFSRCVFTVDARRGKGYPF